MSLLRPFIQSSVGRVLYRPLQRLVHLARRQAHPDVPYDHAVVKASYAGRNFSIVVNRWSESDRMAIAQCFGHAQYEVPGKAQADYIAGVYAGIVASGRKPLIVDCGANIGASVLWLSARYPEAHIVAIEPSPTNFALLSRNCRALDVDLRQAGIGPNDGKAWVDDPGGQGGMGCRVNGEGVGFEIDIISLQTVLASKPASMYVPFLLKVDIEGAESALFTGPPAALDCFPIIFMEPHDWMFPGQKTSVEFFRFHAKAAREFAMQHENVVSISYRTNGRDLAAKDTEYGATENLVAANGSHASR